MRRIRHNIIILILGCIIQCGYCSCDIMELEEPEQLPVLDMYFGQETYYAMEGEEFSISPIFNPDDVTVSDVYWESSDETVATAYDNNIIAKNEGWTTISATSVSKRANASYELYVFPIWNSEDYDNPYEMVIYADITMDGKPFNPEDMVVAAFCGEECRGIGVMKESKGKQYVVLRIGGSLSNMEAIYSDPNVVYGEDEDEAFRERIVFQCYDRKNHLLKKARRGMVFDGETHGYISNLYKLEF